MGEVKQSDEARHGRAEFTPADETTVVAPRFDSEEAATARPVVPLRQTTTGRFSLRASSQHILLAWAVVATLAAGAFALYRDTYSAEPQVTQQPIPQSAAVAATPAPQPVRREVQAAPARSTKAAEAQNALPLWKETDWSNRENVKRDETDEEELEEIEERARKEEKRRRKEEKKLHEEAEKEAERAYKEARKQSERLRERLKDKDGARLIGVINGKSKL